MQHRLFLSGLILSCWVICGAGAVWAQMRNDTGGESAQGANPTTPSPNETGRAEQITHSATGSVTLSDDQRRKLQAYFSNAGQETAEPPGLGLTIGAAVPRQVELRPLPAEVTEVLHKFQGDSYLLVRHELVIVEPKFRRVVAIIPGIG